MQQDKITSRFSVALSLAQTGALWGLAGALVGAVTGYFFLSAKGVVSGILQGINGASFALAVLAGMFVMGQGKVRESDVRIDNAESCCRIVNSGHV